MARASTMPRAVTALTLLLLLCAQCAWSAKLRVRKEIRNLSLREYGMYIQGIATMLTVPTNTGKMLFGDNYHDMAYFIIVHACNAVEPNGAAPLADIAHFGPQFMNYHRAFELLYETTILSIMPSLKAMPYWKMYEDMAGGRYYNTSDSIFSKKYAGALNGDPANDYGVMDGPFAARQVGMFNYYKYAELSPIYNGSISGQLRGPNNLNTNPLFTRYPPSFATSTGATGDLAAGLEMSYSRSMFLRCANTSLVRTSWDFIACIDFPTTILAGLPPNPLFMGDPPGSLHSAFTHGMFHSIIGSVGPNNGATNSTIPFAQVMGDPKDLITSPNDVILFMPFHANLDRLWMIWMKAITKLDPLQASPNVLFGYPKEATNTPPIALNGTALHDILSPFRPFINILPGYPTPTPLGATHFDMLTWKPDYTYDDMQSH